jgi:hypothetical protein
MDKKITQLGTATTPLTGTELIETVQSGTNKKTTTQDIADLVDLTTIQSDISTLQTDVANNTTDIATLQSSKQDNITLTTTGTSGAATLVGSTLNIPQYTGGSGGLKSGVATAAVTDQYTTTIAGATPYAVNDAYIIKFNTANSDGATINISGLGDVQLVKNNDVKITGGDISVGQEFIIIYDGTNFQMLGIAPNQMFAYVTNADSVTITKGQPVYAFGASGDRMSVKLANNTTEATSSKTVGLVFSSSIAPGGLGFVITQGVLSNVNTGSFSAGNTLYVGASAGALTNTMPTAPNHLTRIGIVERANAGNGLIYVMVQNGFQLDELSDVDITSTLPINNDVLTYITGVDNLWKPRSIETILGYTPASYTPRVQTTASASTVTPTSTNDIVTITAQAAALLLGNPTGVWVEGQPLIIRIKDNGTARAISFDTNYRAIGITLPTTTVINKTIYLGIIYNSTDTKWDVIGYNLQA